MANELSNIELKDLLEPLELHTLDTEALHLQGEPVPISAELPKEIIVHAASTTIVILDTHMINHGILEDLGEAVVFMSKGRFREVICVDDAFKGRIQGERTLGGVPFHTGKTTSASTLGSNENLALLVVRTAVGALEVGIISKEGHYKQEEGAYFGIAIMDRDTLQIIGRATSQINSDGRFHKGAVATKAIGVSSTIAGKTTPDWNLR